MLPSTCSDDAIYVPVSFPGLKKVLIRLGEYAPPLTTTRNVDRLTSAVRAGLFRPGVAAPPLPNSCEPSMKLSRRMLSRSCHAGVGVNILWVSPFAFAHWWFSNGWCSPACGPLVETERAERSKVMGSARNSKAAAPGTRRRSSILRR